MSEYEKRDFNELEPYFTTHMKAIAEENLVYGEVACELAYRDKCIKELEEEIQDLELQLNNAEMDAIHGESI
jgi:hypothetical protein